MNYTIPYCVYEILLINIELKLKLKHRLWTIEWFSVSRRERLPLCVFILFSQTLENLNIFHWFWDFGPGVPLTTMTCITQWKWRLVSFIWRVHLDGALCKFPIKSKYISDFSNWSLWLINNFKGESLTFAESFKQVQI